MRYYAKNKLFNANVIAHVKRPGKGTLSKVYIFRQVKQPAQTSKIT